MPHTPRIVKVLLKRMERAGHTIYTANRQGFIENVGAGEPYNLHSESSRFY